MQKFNLYLPKTLLDDLATQALSEGVPIAEIMRRRLQAHPQLNLPLHPHTPRLQRGKVPGKENVAGKREENETEEVVLAETSLPLSSLRD
jgi:hypothetical protein